MESKQAESVCRHIKILQRRVDNLEKELRRVQGEKSDVECTIQKWQNLRNNQDHDYSQRILDIDAKFKRDAAELEKQIKLAKALVDKKTEERETLIGLLKQTNFIADLGEDFEISNWTQLKNLAIKANQMKCSQNMIEKTRTFSELLLRSKHDMNKLMKLRETVLEIKEQFDKKRQVFRSHNADAATKNEEKDKQIAKYKSENERLNLLIKQCTVSDEPMTQFVSDNIRAKCHSFLETDNHEDLLHGLLKFKSRQNRMIKLLRFMECRHIRDCNMLQVALEETLDHTKYYKNLKISINSRMDIDFSLNDLGVLDDSSSPQ